ncbi:GLUG motif-containing protein, partial [uncultured Methylobacterium sp.]|uniref:GLUG motif-containing protein n=1 Tax=uncultured Methylobacterium sp. TaxID=157278 RepID=UPI0035CC912E
MRKPSLFLFALLASTALVGVGPAVAQSLPTGGRVVSGGVNIGTPSGGALAITQSSQTAIVNWQGFSIGQQNRVDIAQPNAQAAILNRVTGGTRSTIAGQLNANGQVYLVNPNGISITRTGKVNAAGFVASTLDTSDDDFRAGRRQFRGSGASASVTNRGTITIGRGGYAALIGGEVSNRGTISVPMGRVGLGSGERATLDLSGDGFLQVAVPTNAKGRGALVRSSGVISADGGSVTLTAAAARDMARQAVNLSGTVEARSVSGHNGSITLSGGDGTVRVASTARLDASGVGGQDGGRVRVTGRRIDLAGSVDVSGARGGRVAVRGGESLALSGQVRATGAAGRGGRVTATAPAITTHAALIDASGASGGGTVRVGGGRQGGGRLAHADTVAIDAGTTIRADATHSGTGGDVVVWSDVATHFAGTISAKGGPQGGDGGQAEVSSHGVLDYTGTTILTAAKGSFGTLLLDPYNVTISNDPDSNQSGFTATGPDSVINATTLTTALETASVTVYTTGSGASWQSGTITLAANTPLSWSGGATLTLWALDQIMLNSAINAPAGGLTVQAGQTNGGAIGATITANGAVSVARFTLASGNWTQNSATLPAFAAGDFQVTGGSFWRVAGGAGTSQSPYLLTDIYGLQGIGTQVAVTVSQNLGASYRLANDIDATGTAAWNGGAGFAPVGNSTTAFTGSLNGAGHTITGLTINRPSQNGVGLIGRMGSPGSVTGLGLVGGSVSGGASVGALVGLNNGGTVSQSYATAAVTGTNNAVGGLVGNNNGGTVSQSYATGAVTGTSSYVGGLIGNNRDGTVIQSYATGAVSGGDHVGGLVGLNAGSNQQPSTITQSYASGRVSGGWRSGGLVGYNAFYTSVTNSSWNTQTSGQGDGIGTDDSIHNSDVTGLTTAQFQSGSLPTGFDSTAWSTGAGLYPYLTILFPNGVQAISGTAYKDAGTTPAASGSAGAVTVSLDAGGARLGQATTGVDGSYYLALPAGTVANGTSFVTSVPASSSLSNAAATVAASTYTAGTPAQAGVNLYGGALTTTTATTLLSAAQTEIASRVAAAATPATATLIAGLTGRNLIATGSGFTIDQAVSTGGTFLVQTTASGAPLTVAQPITIANGGSLSLSAAGALAINAPITAQGAVPVALAYDRNTTTPAVTDLAFAQGSGVSFVNADGSALSSGVGGTLSINGNAYTLLYSMPDLDGIDGTAAVSGGTITDQTAAGGLAGRYALAANLAAAGTTYTDALVGTNSGNSSATRFSGTFEGLGHTLTGLTIAKSGNYAGLFGYSTGTIRDIGLVGGSVSGISNVGALVGYNGVGGIVTQAYATGAVSGSTQAVGGLVGSNLGTVRQAYATGAVSGSSLVGGLVGYNGGGTVTQAYATGAVSGGSNSNYVGGLVGWNNGGTVTQAYATGAVSGGPGSSYVGGLVGQNYSGGRITQAYATGAVSAGSGSNFVGGLAGYSQGTVSQAYWDTQTSGQPASAAGTGLTTRQLQGLDPLAGGGTITDASHLGASFAGGAGGLYPYLTNFFPNGVQAVSGVAYTDAGATPAASGSAGAVTVSLDAGGGRIGQATTGNNGYYYIATAAGTVANGTSFVASVPTNGSLSNAAATLAASTYTAGTPAQGGVNLYGGALTVPTTATTLSTAPTLVQAQASANAAASPTTRTLIGGLTGRGLIATGSGFTIDQAVSTGGTFLVQTTASGAPLTVARPITIANGGSLSLSAAGALSINAPIVAQGAVPVALAYDRNTTTPAITDLAFAQGSGLSFVDANGGALSSGVGGTLSINGNPYTLLYSMADLDGIDGTAAVSGGTITNQSAAGGLSGRYALAGDFAADGITYTNALVGTNSSFDSATRFSGTFEGLGHTLTGLTISKSGDYAGLFGYSSGTIRDIGLVGGSVSGSNAVGGLVGQNAGGTITQSYATGAVSGGAFYVGGLVGYNNGGTVSQSYATGAVTGTSSYVGGLVGYNNVGTVGQSYATGAVSGGSGSGYVGGFVGLNNGFVTQAYATGAVSAGSGSGAVGGFVGLNGGTVRQAYATGAVSGGANSEYVGGFVGLNGGTVGQAYATGAVSAGSGSQNVGGLVGGQGGGTITQAYWDTQTSGQAASAGGTGLTTAQLQSGSASGLGASFAGGANGLYPYLTSFFPNGVQAVSGIAYTDAGSTFAASGASGAVTVSLDAGGGRIGQATTGNNGYYYIATAAGTVANGTSFVASVPTNGSLSNAAATLAASTYTAGTPAQGGVNLYGGALTVPTTATTLSTAPTLVQAQASANAAASPTTRTLIGGLTGRGLIATGSGFTIDQAVSTGGTFLVQTTASGAPLTVAQPITIANGGSLSLSAAGALAVNAPVVAQGAVPVALAYDRNTTTPSVTDLAFAQGSGLSFVDANGSAATGALAGRSLTVNGNPYTLLYSMADLDGIDGTAASGNAINAQAGGLSGRYALAGDLAAAGTTYTDALVGNNSSNSTATRFSGTFEGLGHTLTGLTIAKTGNYAGLFGYSSGTIRDLGLVGGSVSGTNIVGALVGWNNGGTVTQAYATGAVSGSTQAVGGLVGTNNFGTVSQAYATGAVSGLSQVGGLVGWNNGTVTQAYAAGAVSGGANSDNVGGLVGFNSGTVEQAYATGAVSGGTRTIFLGGLVGANNGTVTQAYATGAVSGGSAPNFLGGLVGSNNGTVSQAYATGAVSGGSGSNNVGGLAGYNQGTVSQAYWDTQTSGRGVGIGVDTNSQSGNVTGLTTRQLQGLDPLAGGGSFSAVTNLGNGTASVFAGGANGLYPYLTNFFPNGVQAVSGVAYTDAGATPAASGSAGAVTVSLDAGGGRIGQAT